MFVIVFGFGLKILIPGILGLFVLGFFPQHLVEGLLNFRRRVSRSFWLDLAFQDPPGKTDQ